MHLAVADVIGGLEFFRQAMGRARERIADEGLLLERERWLLWVPVALALGVSGYFLLPVEPSVWIGPAAGVLFGLAFLSRRRTWLTFAFSRPRPRRLRLGRGSDEELERRGAGFAREDRAGRGTRPSG